MTSILGPAPILDFDGTLARLGVDWEDLRRRLGVGQIEALWSAENAAGWRLVTEAEVAAAAVAVPVESVLAELGLVSSFAVLTSNSATAVRRFLERYPALLLRLADVVGRDELEGPKTAFSRFQGGFARCVAATAPKRGREPVVFVGDADYELAFAQRLGATAVDVATMGRLRPGPPPG